MHKYVWLTFSDADKGIFLEIAKITPFIKEVNLAEKTIRYQSKSSIFEIVIDERRIYFDNNLANVLWKIVNDAHIIAQTIRIESGLYGEKKPGEVMATLKSLITKWYYASLENKITVLDIAADLMYSLLTRHKFHNGNKRTGLLAAVIFLDTCGFYIKFDPRRKNNIGDWEKFVIDIVEKKSEGYAEDTQIKEISRWFETRVLISYTWR